MYVMFLRGMVLFMEIPGLDMSTPCSRPDRPEVLKIQSRESLREATEKVHISWPKIGSSRRTPKKINGKNRRMSATFA